MHALLLYPRFPDTFWSFKYALQFVAPKASLPPLGLLTVAAMLPEAWEKRLVDVNVRALSEADLAWADCAFVSAMTVQREDARRLIARCKAAGLPVVAGGPLFTAEHDAFASVDHFVLGEAERTLPPFLADFAAGRARRRYTTSDFADLHATPAPLWELADLDRYASASVQYSRGCPFDCDFCNVTTLFGHRPRVKTPGQVVAELDALYERGWRRQVFFVDDNLIGNRRHFEHELLPALLAWREGKEGMRFNTQVSINLADRPALMERMVAAGFNAVFIGIETPDAESLAECSKTQNLKRDLVEDVRRIHRAGLEVQGGFIVGFDHDTPSVFGRQIDFIQRSGIVTAMVGLLIALPGTRLFERMKQAGRLVGEVSGDNADGTTNIVPRMDLDVLRAGYRSILRHIYSPGPYYERVRTFLQDYPLPRVGGRRPSLNHLLAFARSMVRLGVLERERAHYWKLLRWTLRHRPGHLSLAVRFAIYGYHFRKTSELHVA